MGPKQLAMRLVAGDPGDLRFVAAARVGARIGHFVPVQVVGLQMSVWLHMLTAE